MLDQMFRERDDVAPRQVGGEMSAFGVLGAAEPDRRFFLRVNQHALRHIEGPAVEAGEPAHIGGILADDEVEAGFVHPCFDL